MKRMVYGFFALFALSVFLAVAPLTAADFVEGIHYVELKDRVKSPTPQMDELWSVYCPYCMKWEPVIAKLEQKLAEKKVPFKGQHLLTKGMFGVEASNVLAVAKSLGPEKHKAVKDALYKKIITERASWDSAEAFYNDVFGLGIITKAEYDKLMQTPEVMALLTEWGTYTPVAKVQGIPGFLVNNRYIINIGEMKNVDMFFELVDFLLAK